MKRLGHSLALACALGLFLSLTQAAAPASRRNDVPDREQEKPFTSTAEELKFCELTNLERKKKDLPPLTLSVALSKVARAHSENMARQGKMEHKLDGKTHGDRLKAAGYKFSSAGENIAEGFAKAPLPAVMKALMDSQHHRENILRAESTEIGIGIARDKDAKPFYTQIFATPRKD